MCTVKTILVYLVLELNFGVCVIESLIKAEADQTPKFGKQVTYTITKEPYYWGDTISLPVYFPKISVSPPVFLPKISMKKRQRGRR